MSYESFDDTLVAIPPFSPTGFLVAFGPAVDFPLYALARLYLAGAVHTSLPLSSVCDLRSTFIRSLGLATSIV